MCVARDRALDAACDASTALCAPGLTCEGGACADITMLGNGEACHWTGGEACSEGSCTCVSDYDCVYGADYECRPDLASGCSWSPCPIEDELGCAMRRWIPAGPARAVHRGVALRPPCHCRAPAHAPRLVVLTGGPGAGKTAVLEVVQRHFCEHVVVVPEAASILFGGGFPRLATIPARRAAQRAIFHVQRELERMVIDEGRAAIALGDRGTLDGLAYWDGEPDRFWADVGQTRHIELARYAAVIHLRTPADGSGYDHSNPLRIETAAEAQQIDERILDAWTGHPHRVVVDSHVSFLDKLSAAIEAIRREVPPCCRSHPVELSSART